MPCYQIRTMSVEFHARHRKLLFAALDSIGWRYEVNGQTIDLYDADIVLHLDEGRAELFGGTRSQGLLNNLKQAYSRQAIRKAAKMQGWQVKANGQKGVIRR